MSNKEHARVILETVEAVENRCMAVDGPVTQFMDEVTVNELKRIYEAAKAIAESAVPQLPPIAPDGFERRTVWAVLMPRTYPGLRQENSGITKIEHPVDWFEIEASARHAAKTYYLREPDISVESFVALQHDGQLYAPITPVPVTDIDRRAQGCLDSARMRAERRDQLLFDMRQRGFSDDDIELIVGGK